MLERRRLEAHRPHSFIQNIKEVIAVIHCNIFLQISYAFSASKVSGVTPTDLSSPFLIRKVSVLGKSSMIRM